VVSGSDDGTIRVWDLKRGEAIHTLCGHSATITGVAVTPESSHVVSTSADTTLKVWDLEEGKELRGCHAHRAGVARLAITGDGRHALTSGGEPDWMCEVEVWDVAAGEEVCVAGRDRLWYRSLAMTPDGGCAVSAFRSRKLKFWHLERLERGCSAGPEVAEHYRRYSNRKARVNKLKELQAPRAVLRNEESMLSRAKDLLCQTLDALMKERKVVHVNTDYRSGHETVALTPDGRRAVSVTWEGALYVWDVREPTVLAEFTLDNAPRACAVTPDGLTIVVGEKSGAVHFLRLEGVESLTAGERIERPAGQRKVNLIASLCSRLREGAGSKLPRREGGV
jgi:WD40 repeat protein